MSRFLQPVPLTRHQEQITSISSCGGCLTLTPVRLGAERIIFIKKTFFKSKTQVRKGCMEHAAESHIETYNK